MIRNIQRDDVTQSVPFIELIQGNSVFRNPCEMKADCLLRDMSFSRQLTMDVHDLTLPSKNLQQT